jgi:hypothetical protein
MAAGKSVVRLALVVVLALVAFAAGWLTGRIGLGSTVDPGSLGERERQFAEQLTGASLVGRFTIAGREDQQARPERYDISSIEKVGENQWRFNARIRYGSVDSTVPIVLPVQWAGDTPMITMTDVSIPSLGTFTARVFFYGDRYAGTWQHDQVGGQMYGRIERMENEER